jgi:hypothetical protein
MLESAYNIGGKESNKNSIANQKKHSISHVFQC